MLGLPPALRMFMTYWADYDLAMSLWLAAHFQASVPHDMVYALLGLAPKDESALIIPDYSKPVEAVYFDVYKSLILHSKSLSCVLFNRTCHSGHGPSWILQVAPRLSAAPLWANDGTFKAAANVPMDIYFKDDSRHMVAMGIKIGVLDAVVGPHSQIQQSQPPHRSEEQPDELESTAELPSAVSFRNFMEDLKVFRQTLSSDDDLEGLWRTLAMDHDMSDLDNPITPAPRHFGEEFEVATGCKDVPADYEPDLPPDMKRPHYLQFSKFLYNVLDSTQNRCFFRTACGKMGLGPYDSKEGDVVAALFGAERFFMLRPISTGYQVVGDAYVQGGMFGEFVSAYVNGDDSAVEEFVLC
ncbi:hypothetical protein FDECE_12417 [Fusarium decemcellulare]|nr:hypothetical protein FDECE_12417 [Fusarium decemcellulare]